MSNHNENPIIKALKRQAHDIKKRDGITHAHALDQVAAREGFKNWMRLLDAAKFIQAGGQQEHGR